MHQRIFNYLQKRNTDRKISIISRFVGSSGTLLDFGCGDLSLAKRLYQKNPHMGITGVDVVDFGVRYSKIKFRCYDGNRIPFGDKTFDIVLCYHALHHCHNPVFALRECIRVAKKRLLIIEPTYRWKAEAPIMRGIDILLNYWKTKTISPPSYYLSKMKWLRHFSLYPVSVIDAIPVEIFPVFLPTGVSYLFILDKKTFLS